MKRISLLLDKVNGRLDALDVEAWTNPGPHIRAERDHLLKQREGLENLTKDLIADLEAFRKRNEEKLSSGEEQLRAIWQREYDLQKHVTTLSTASILGLGALTSFFPSASSLSSAAAPSLVAFLLAIVLAMLGMEGSNLEILAVTAKPENYPRPRWFRALEWVLRNGFGLCRAVSLLVFCLGVLGVVLFVLEHA